MVARIAVALLAGIATLAVYARTERVVVDFERGYEGAFVDGFYPRERAGGSYFRWTPGSSDVVFRHLPRGELEVDARLKTIRPSGSPLPELNFTANGVTVHRARALPGIVSYRFAFPVSEPTLRLGIESETFEAGGGRRLGVQVLGVTLTRASEGLTGILPATLAALASFLWAAALGSAVAALAVSGGFVYLLAQGPVPFSSYPLQILALSAVAYVSARAIRFALDRKEWLHESERPRVAGLLVLIAVAKVALVSYPLMLSSDADFQGNRMSELLRGNWYTTSVTQHDPPFRIPYPVSLYAVASPLVKLGLDRVPALEIVTALGDAAVSVMLLVLGVRFLDDLRAGMLAAVLYQLVPMNASAFSAGNFTNLFAVAMTTVAFAFLVIANSEGNRRLVAFASFATLLAITAHFGMLIEGVVLWPVWLLGLALVPPGVKNVRKTTAVAVIVAFGFAGAYYLGYWELVMSQLDRAVGGSTASASGTYHPAFIAEQLGWVFCLTALLGLLTMLRRPLENPFSALVMGWILVTAVFLVVELTTAVEVRYWLQALPVLALVAARYLSLALDRPGTGRIAAVAAIAYMSFVGLANLADVALVRYH